METKLPNLIHFGREVCGDLAQAERREWWLTNGVGGYASGTVAGTLTRRHHGLLVAPVKPPLDPRVVMAKAHATLLSGKHSWPLFSNRCGGGMVDPAGYLDIETFRLDGRIPVWRYACGELRVESRIWMERGENTTYVGWRLAADSPVPEELARLRVKLLVNARDFDAAAQARELDLVIEGSGPELRVVHPGWFTLYVSARGGTIATRHEWYENFDLAVEGEHGLAGSDSHLCVGEAELTLHPGDWVGVVASLNAQPSVYLDEALQRAQARDLGWLRRAQVQVPELIGAPAWVDQLVLAADSFVFSRTLADAPDGEALTAGYPWFGDRGRDTMIALPGLTLATGRYDSARRILQTFARFVDRGMLPDVLPGAGDTPEYTTADAALWFIEAWRAYVEVIDDRECLRQAFPVLESIIDWHVKGTRDGIGMDPADGLLRAGAPGVQLTSVDARVSEWVVTPRAGKPVEINALWFNALSAMAQLAELLKLPSKAYAGLAKRARTGFQHFLNPAGGLFDVLDAPEGDDPTVRPGQILAVSLPFSALDRECQEMVVRACKRELLTCYGLRNLNPSDRDFPPHWVGDMWERDGEPHGPAWSFLLGHYALAEHRVTGDAAAAQAHLDPLRDHLLNTALGSASAIFDRARPHTRRGAPPQAWSVACTLEAWWRLEKAKQEAKPGDSGAKATSHPRPRRKQSAIA
jgi:predicted glycogen debranching enzyme